MTVEPGDAATANQSLPAHQRSAINAADRVFRSGLLTGNSSFDPTLRIWTSAATARLRTHFVERPDESSDVFLAKLARQLSDAGDEAIVLAAELLYLNMLPLEPGQIGQTTKQRILDTVLSWAKQPVLVPDGLTASMRGFMNGGQAFLNYRPFQLQFLILLTDSLVNLADAERAAVLSDPWAFRTLCDQTLEAMGDNKARAQLHTLLYLMFPQTFIPSANADHKARIRAAFLDRVAQPTDDLDRDLSAIRESIAVESSGPADFYSEPW